MEIIKAPQEILKELAVEFGEELFTDKILSMELILDYFKDRKVKRLFTDAIWDDLPNLLFEKKTISGSDKIKSINELKSLYKEDHCLEEVIVNFLVDSFAHALNIVAEPPKIVFTSKDVQKYNKYNEVKIPYGFTEIGSRAFEWNTSLSGVTIPPTVTTISDHAFSECHMLDTICIPGTVLFIGDYAFDSCGLSDTVILPEGVVRLGDGVFSGCDYINEIILPRSILHIGYRLFDPNWYLEKLKCFKGSYAEEYAKNMGLSKIIEYL